MKSDEVSAGKAQFLKLLRQGIQQKLEAFSPHLQMDGEQVKSVAGINSQKHLSTSAWRTITWRNAHSTSPVFEQDVANKTLGVKQVQNGELNGFGTGLTVWPAACVLLKYLEHRYGKIRNECELKCKYVLELGSGTGAVGLTAALLGAGRVVLSDTAIIQPFLADNVAFCKAMHSDLTAEVQSYEWGKSVSKILLMDREGRECYPDIILVSDCIIPRLYSIEPLVDALGDLSGPKTLVLISYEHRYNEEFELKERFWSLMLSRGFHLRQLRTDEYHPHYSADDIEIWEVFRLGTTLSDIVLQQSNQAIDTSAESTSSWFLYLDRSVHEHPRYGSVQIKCSQNMEYDDFPENHQIQILICLCRHISIRRKLMHCRIEQNDAIRFVVLFNKSVRFLQQVKCCITNYSYRTETSIAEVDVDGHFDTQNSLFSADPLGSIPADLKHCVASSRLDGLDFILDYVGDLNQALAAEIYALTALLVKLEADGKKWHNWAACSQVVDEETIVRDGRDAISTFCN
uniref:Uncharacterized protein AlNc14C2G266 n=1 Tax=Albugo laibachii Nc14 TaxID=890382 RepID=F0VZC8_9STRA|nr:conserved unknown protein putative [Albugo laibachii Nc14]|eukprot:CCA14158.1 conserved unknown protein putative [Albugo laibachii Nc14]